jgi:hypothetical protein
MRQRDSSKYSSVRVSQTQASAFGPAANQLLHTQRAGNALAG